MAAGVAYYALLSLFPLLLGLISLYGLFLSSESVQEQLLDFFRDNFPGSIDWIERNIEDVIRLRGVVGALSLVLLLWSGSRLFSAMRLVVNRAWGIQKGRPFHIGKLIDVSMVLGIGVLAFLSLAATTAIQAASPHVGLLATVALNFGRLLPFLMNLAIFLIIYKFIPNTKTLWRYVWPGALVAAVVAELAKSLFALYLREFANYDSLYGSLGSVIALLVWVYISALILILGAEFTSEYSRFKNRGRLVEAETSGGESPEVQL